MAVIRRGGFPRRQEDPLIQQLLEKARQEAAQSSAIGSPSMYTAAAGGGIGPVAGVLTAQILAGARSKNALQAAQLKEEQTNIASSKLAEVLANRQVDGKKMGTDGRFYETTSSESIPIEEVNLADALKQTNSLGEGFVTPIKPREEVVMQDGKPVIKQLPITLDQIPEEERFLYTGTRDKYDPTTVDIPGTPKADNILAKIGNIITGKQNVKDIKAANLFELAAAARIPPEQMFAYLQAEEQKEEGKYQNISPVNVEKDGNIYPTKTAAFIVNGEIKQVLLNPESKVYELYENSDYKIVDDAKQTTKNRAESFQESNENAVREYIKTRPGINLTKEQISAVAARLSRGKQYTEQGLPIDTIGDVISNILNYPKTDVESIDTEEKVNKAPAPIAARIKKDVSNLASDINKADIVTSYTTLSNLENFIQDLDNIPGAGPFAGGVPKFLLSAEGKQFRLLYNKLINLELKDRSGAAVTVPEFERFRQEYPLGFARTEKEIREAIKTAKQIFDSRLLSLYSLYPKNITSIYSKRQGAIVPKSQQDIKTLLRNKYGI
jgi:hypothetical protein